MRWWKAPSREAPAGGTFEHAVLPHLDDAHNFARWLVRDAHLAEDVVQDAMLRAFRHYAGFRGDDARPWLMRIVRNTAYTALARRDCASVPLHDAAGDAAEAAPALQVADPADDPEAALVRRQRGERLDAALAALPVELRECLVLRELEALSYKQIAEVTGMPIGTVMSRLWRARQALLGEGAER